MTDETIHPALELNDTVHQRVRLAILTVLSEATEVTFAALRDGVEVTDPCLPVIAGGAEHGLRVCLGATPNTAVLEDGLRRLARALGDSADRALGMV